MPSLSSLNYSALLGLGMGLGWETEACFQPLPGMMEPQGCFFSLVPLEANCSPSPILAMSPNFPTPGNSPVVSRWERAQSEVQF